MSETAEITIFEKGDYVSFANCGLPYYLGGEIKLFSKLQITTPQALKDRFNLNVNVNAEVVGIDRAARIVTVRDAKSGNSSTHEYDDLVLAVGCEAIVPRAIPGIERSGHFTLRSLEDTSAIEQYMAAVHPCRICVCGGGFIGLEIAEQFTNRGYEVSIVEAMDQVMAPLDPELAEELHAELRQKGIVLHLSDGVASFEQPSQGAAASDVLLRSGTRLPADLVILASGIRPSTKLAADAGMELTSRGYIKVDDRMRSVTDPHVWAVGDAIEVGNAALGGDATWAVALGGPANRQGRLCADNIARKPGAGAYRGTIGASVVKVFSLTAASVGVNEKFLRNTKSPYKAIYLHPSHHAGYYPDAQHIHLKLLFDPTNGKILGAEAVGKQGVEKRIDVISTAMHGGLSANELAYLELCYAPPYNSARDPVNMSGMIAENIMDGLDDTITPLELVDLARSGSLVATGTTVLDVRDAHEMVGNKVLSAIPEVCRMNIPLNELRRQLGELRSKLLTPDGPIIVSCQTGQRAHVASRMLRQSGFTDCKVLTGSYLTYTAVQSAPALQPKE